jgi:hypothetical protein
VCFKVKHKRVHIAQDQAQTETTLNIAQLHHKEKLQIQTPGKNKEEKKKALARIPSLGRYLPMTQLTLFLEDKTNRVILLSLDAG